MAEITPEIRLRIMESVRKDANDVFEWACKLKKIASCPVDSNDWDNIRDLAARITERAAKVTQKVCEEEEKYTQ